MRLALREAERALEHDDVPIGCVVVHGGEVIAAARNERELRGDPTAHAEILALREAARRHRGLAAARHGPVRDARALRDVRGRDRAGARAAGRLRRADPKAGAAGSVLDVLGEPRLNHRPGRAAGLLADGGGELLRAILRLAARKSASKADKRHVRPYSEQVLRALENRYGPLPEGVPSVAYIFEPGIEGRCLYISPSVEDVLGYPRRQWLEERGLWDRILHPDDEERVVSNEAECARSGEKLVQEYRLRAADGRDVWIRDEMTVVFDRRTGKDPLFYGVFLDVSDRKRMETELERLALYDALTGLPNRALFADRLRHVLARRGRDRPPRPSTSSTSTASSASTTRSATAPAIRCCARWRERLRGVLRPEDTVARFGGDEFTVLCESVGGVLEAVAIADRLQRPLRQPAARRRGGAAPEHEHRRGAGRGERRRRRPAPDRGRRRRDVPGQGARRRAHRAVRHAHARRRRARAARSSRSCSARWSAAS